MNTPVFTPVSVSVIVVAAASWWLVPQFGLLGAAWATCLGVAVQALLRGAFVWRIVMAAPAGASGDMVAEECPSTTPPGPPSDA